MQNKKEAPVREQVNLQGVSTADLIDELVARGAMNISTEPYSGYVLKKTYVDDRTDRNINAETVLVLPGAN